MRIGILQPSYLPWLGYFEQIYKVDVFVFYDDVQYDKNGWRNRNKIRGSNGFIWLTVPVFTKGKAKQLIKDVIINNNINWRKKHIRTLEQYYRKAPFFEDYFPEIKKILEKNWEKLCDLNITLIKLISEFLNIKTPFYLSSNLKISGGRIDRLIKICKYFKADEFYEGASGRNYIDTEIFKKEGIKVIFQDYKHPIYKQQFEPFLPYMSIVDLLFNHGDKSLKILLNNNG